VKIIKVLICSLPALTYNSAILFSATITYSSLKEQRAYDIP